MKKSYLYLPLLCLFCLMLTLLAFADTVYVKAGGNGDGTAAKPFGTVADAVNALGGRGGTVVIDGTVNLNAKTTVPVQSDTLTFVGQNNGRLALSQRFQFAPGAEAYDIVFDLPMDNVAAYDCYIFGGFNNVTFTENAEGTHTATGYLCFFGGVHATEIAAETDAVCDHPYSIDVHSGVFRKFGGGNLRGTISDMLGATAEPITMTIYGGTFGVPGTTYDLTSQNTETAPFSLSGMSMLTGGGKLTISGGTFNTPIYIQGGTDTIPAGASDKSAYTAKDKKYYALSGDVELNISGGSFNVPLISAYQTQITYTQVLRGNFDVEISGSPVFAQDTVIDATQVKAYAGEDKAATLRLAGDIQNVSGKRFDLVNDIPQTYEEPLRVAFVGDSITEGYAPTTAAVDRRTQSYPAVFLSLCEAAGKDVIVSNFGVSAAGMLESLARYYPDSRAYPVVTGECDADIVFFALGTNDNAVGGTTGAVDAFIENYSTFIEAVGNLPTTKKVYVTNAIYRFNTATRANNVRVSSVIHPMQAKIAADLIEKYGDKYAFVDLYGLTRDAAKNGTLLSTDGLHPGVPGYAVMGQALYGAAFDGILAPTTDYKRTEIYVSVPSPNNNTHRLAAGTKEDPVSELYTAFDLIPDGADATIHIMGTVPYSENLVLPYGPHSLTIVGEGSGAKLTLGGSDDAKKFGLTFKMGCDVKFDNITLDSVNSTYFCANWHNVELTSRVRLTGTWSFFAGALVYNQADPATTSAFDTVASASSDNDFTLRLEGKGSFYHFILGNHRMQENAPFGTYSGEMTALIGKDIQIIGSDEYHIMGVCGQNYLTGNIYLRNLTAKSDLADYAAPGTLGDVVYDAENNTGSIVTTPDFDADGDGEVTLLDVLSVLRTTLDGGYAFHGDANADGKITLADVLHLMKIVAE